MQIKITLETLSNTMNIC